jgi:hypothetical protein
MGQGCVQLLPNDEAVIMPPLYLAIKVDRPVCKILYFEMNEVKE